MRRTPLSLLPFSSKAPQISLTAALSVTGSQLTVRFNLRGKLDTLAIPCFEHREVQRRDDLWKQTCFEIFISQADLENYWEINLAPSGAWNIYRFAGYRSEMRQEEALQSLPTARSRAAEEFKLAATIDLQRLSRQPHTLRIGVTAVLAEKSGRLSYWAIKHAPERPDFHWPGNFCLSLPPGA